MIRAILVDDEPLALNHLKKMLTESGHIEVANIYSNPETVIKELNQLDFQVAFLDIEMPEINGLELAEMILQWNQDIHIVFVSAYRDYAIQAFELYSIDYIMKPITKKRLQKTVLRIIDQMQLGDQQSQIEQIASIKITYFDEFSVYVNDIPIKWKTSKVKELFAFFLMNLNTYVHRDSIIEALWPENDYQKAKIQLHTSISHLRKTLDSFGYPQVITFTNQSYALELTDFKCDVIELEELIEKHTQINKENAHKFEQIILQYHGDYLERNGYEWAMTKAQSIRQLLLQLLQKMIDYYAETNNMDKHQYYLQHLLNLNPYAEHTLQQLMQHYINIGNRGDAITIFHNFKELLLEDLGILPNQTTNELYESILIGYR